jgi:rod shape-determining protein MreD
MRIIPYILYLLLISFYQTIGIGLISIGPAHIQLTALIVLLVALRKEYLASLWFAMAAGLIYDAQDPGRLGAQMMILTLICMATSLAKERLNLESIQSRILLVLVGLVLYTIPETLLYTTSGTTEFPLVLARVGLPSIVYTAAVATAIFLFQSGLWSWRKFRALF